jgi:hypothetical protein
MQEAMKILEERDNIYEENSNSANLKIVLLFISKDFIKTNNEKTIESFFSSVKFIDTKANNKLTPTHLLLYVE